MYQGIEMRWGGAELELCFSQSEAKLGKTRKQRME